MSTDRELLGLAAKAAGIVDMFWWEEMCCFQIPGDLETELWNPLTDDGDALRLAVKLLIQIDPLPKEMFVGWGFQKHTPQRAHELREFYEADQMAATRRAIVLAAAEIGKRTP